MEGRGGVRVTCRSRPTNTAVCLFMVVLDLEVVAELAGEFARKPGAGGLELGPQR